MPNRARLTVTSAVLLVGGLTSACGGGGGGGGGGAPSDASETDFCQTQSSLLEDLLPDDMSDPQVPSNDEMAKAVKSWGK